MTRLQKTRLRIGRLRLACLFVQIVIVEWLVIGVYSRASEWLYTNSIIDPTQLPVMEVIFVVNIAGHVLLLLAMWIFSRGLCGWLAWIGALLIFNVLLITVLRDGLGLLNWLWSVNTGEKLVQHDPLQPYFQFVTLWMWQAIWLMMIIAGIATAHDINIRYDGQLLQKGRLRNLLIAAIVTWVVITADAYGFYPLLRWLYPGTPTMNNIGNVITGMTVLRLVLFLPTVVFCVMLFRVMSTIRKVLASPTLRICPECGYALHERAPNRCPECGWGMKTEMS